MPRVHRDTCRRIQIVSTCIHLLPSTCFLYPRQKCRQFVARLLLDTKGHKSTVTLMNSNYVAEIQSTCIPNEQHVSGDVTYVRRHMYPDTSCSFGIHVSGRHCVLVHYCAKLFISAVQWWCLFL